MVSAAALVCASHSPLMGFTEPAHGVRQRVDAAFADARRFIASYAADLVVLFGPDHYNAMFYDLMPPFCIVAAATSLGDYKFPTRPLSVDHEAAMAIVRVVLDMDVDVAYPAAMSADQCSSH